MHNRLCICLNINFSREKCLIIHGKKNEKIIPNCKKDANIL